MMVEMKAFCLFYICIHVTELQLKIYKNRRNKVSIILVKLK